MTLVAAAADDAVEVRTLLRGVHGAAQQKMPAASRYDTLHRIEHDIRHELGTIKLLAAVLAGSKDIGPTSRARVSQLIAETRWLDELVTAREFLESERDRVPEATIRVDSLVAEIVRSVRLSSRLRIHVETEVAWGKVDRLAMWRAFRNVIGNAAEAAGPEGTLAVTVGAANGLVVVDVEDDGPGFDLRLVRPSALGLTITSELLDACGGSLRIGHSDLGGCRVRLSVPQAAA